MVKEAEEHKEHDAKIYCFAKIFKYYGK